MRMPGFHAGASLYRSGRPYAMAYTGTISTAVLPQQGGVCESICWAQYIGCLTATPWGVLSLGCTVVFATCLRSCPPPPPPPCTYMGTCSGANRDACVSALCGACPAGQYNCLTRCSWRWSNFDDVCDVYCCTPTVSEPS
jgi:hypothetical protein